MDFKHHEVFSMKDCPPGFDVLARSVDGEIEAIRHKMFDLEGWMWHPEREANFCELQLARAERLLMGEISN